MFPFCRLDEKKEDFIFFTNTTMTPNQRDLTKGIRFNNASGLDAFVIKIQQDGNDFNLVKGAGFFHNKNVLISNLKKTIIELDYNQNGDTIISKNVFAFPFFGANNKPDRKFITIDEKQINYNDTSIIVGEDKTPPIVINNRVFELKSNFHKFSKYFVIPFLFIVIFIFSILLLIELYNLSNNSKISLNRNIVGIELFNILSLRLLFNCIILLGIPILLLKSIENINNDFFDKHNRLFWITTFVLILNINWYNLLRLSYKKINTKSKAFRLLSFIACLVILVLTTPLCTSNEQVLGFIPVLKLISALVILVPFALLNFPKELQKYGNKILNSIKLIFSRDKLTKNTYISHNDFFFYFINYSVIFILTFVVTIFFAKDFATLIFIIISFILLVSLNRERVYYIINSTNYSNIILTLFFIIVSGYFLGNILFSEEKQYRFFSTYYFPDDDKLNNYSNIESSRETIAGQVFLLNSIQTKIIPNFKTQILPEFKTVFFTDYAVLWSFVIGNWLWFFIYLCTLIMLSYCIMSLIIIFSRKITLVSRNVHTYNEIIIIGITLLLSLFLIQYIYTFLTNFWLLPLTGQPPGLLSPSYSEYVFHIILINYLFIFLNSSIPDRVNHAKSSYNGNSDIYMRIKRHSLTFPALFFLLSLFILLIQKNKIDKKLDLTKKMSWSIPKEFDLDSLRGLSKEALLHLAKNSFDIMEGDVVEKRKFNNYLSAYYENKDSKHMHSLTMDYITDNICIDSITKIKTNLINKIDNSFSIRKYLNGTPVLFLNNKYTSGCPPDAETINFELQSRLNKVIEDWAKRIDSINRYKMIGGSIIVADNDNGYIRASASYPFLYNENIYHLQCKNNDINEFFKQSEIDSTERLKIRYNHGKSYTNFSEFDLMPGSIIKPLLAYNGLKFLPENYSEKWLSVFLGQSYNNSAVEIYNDLYIKNNFFNESISICKSDFDFFPYTYNYNLLTESNNYTSHSIGQQQKLLFKNIVQAYIRIKTNKKVKLTYYNNDVLEETPPLSLHIDDLIKLKRSMCTLRKGRALGLGNLLKRKGVNIENFLAKTGTAQIGKNENFNRTSAIIVVGDKLTVGIQLYGVIPKNENELSAQFLLRYLIENEIVEF